MKSIKLEPGKYYFYDYANGYIIQVREINNNNIIPRDVIVLYNNENGNYYYKEDHCSSWSNNNLTGPKTREATQEEINWLLACREAKTFVPKPKLINYEIY